MHLPKSSEATVTPQLSPYTVHHLHFGLTNHHSQLTTDHSPFHTVEAQTTFLMFASGDEAALGWMYNRFYGPLIRYGCRIVGDEFEVSVLVQEAFLRLWELRARISSMYHAWCFLRLVLRWKCYAWHRRRKAVPRVVWKECMEDLAVADGADILLYEQQYEEKRRLVMQALAYLPPKKQTVLKLHFHYGFGCRQIARHMGSTASVAVNRELEASIQHLRSVLRLTKKAAPVPVKKRALLQGCAESLSSEEEAVFRLRYEGKKSFTEIASRLGRPQQVVEQAYIRAWLRVRKQKAGSPKTTPLHG